MRSRKEKNDWTIGLSFLLASHVSPYFLHSPEGTAIIHSEVEPYILDSVISVGEMEELSNELRFRVAYYTYNVDQFE